jgi:hypothetical protein
MYKTCCIGGLAGLGAVLFVLLLSSTVAAVPLSAFIRFGQAVGDTRLQANDDGSSAPISLRESFPFFGVSQQSLFVNNNGNITFNSSLSDFTPFAFPSVNQIIAPYFADVDTTGPPDVSGDGLDDVYFSERTNQTDLGIISTIVNQAFGGAFAATSAFVATWDHVGYFTSHVDKLNTFQGRPDDRWGTELRHLPLPRQWDAVGGWRRRWRRGRLYPHRGTPPNVLIELYSLGQNFRR